MRRPPPVSYGISFDIVADMRTEETARPLYVRLPARAADALDAAASESGRSKRDLVTELVTRLLPPPLPPPGGERRVVVEMPADGLTVGRAETRPAEPPAVLTTAEAAELLRVAERDVVGLAESGELPGRRVGDGWRFSRGALLEWLGSA